MQNGATDESAEHHYACDLLSKETRLVGYQVKSDCAYKDDLADEAEHHMDEDIHAFLLPNKKLPLGFLPQSLVLLDLIVIFLILIII